MFSCSVFSDLDLRTFLYICCPIQICNVLVTHDRDMLQISSHSARLRWRLQGTRVRQPAVPSPGAEPGGTTSRGRARNPCQQGTGCRRGLTIGTGRMFKVKFKVNYINLCSVLKVGMKLQLRCLWRRL